MLLPLNKLGLVDFTKISIDILINSNFQVPFQPPCFSQTFFNIRRTARPLHCNGQVRGHSTTTWFKFYPILNPSPLKYLSFVTWPLHGLSTDPQPPSSFPRSYWMPPLGKNKIETTPITLCQILGHDLFCGKSAMLAINMDFSSPRNYSENDRSFAHIPIRKLAFFSRELAAGLLLSEAVMLRLS